MEVDHDDLVDLVEESKTRLRNRNQMCRGTCVELYKFSNKGTTSWKYGEIFNANRIDDISFKGVLGDIEARDGISKRSACFSTHESNYHETVQSMMVRSSTLRHKGVLKPYIAGYNTQISQLVCGFSETSMSLGDWLRKKSAARGPDIPFEVQELIRTAYLAIEKIWSEGSSSDHLANISSYDVIDRNVKINPLCTRSKRNDEIDILPIRCAFGQMLKDHIFIIWRDVELLDFIDLLSYPAAKSAEDILEHPLLLSPERRELLYHKFDKSNENLMTYQINWLAAKCNLGLDWETMARNVDLALKEVIKFQIRQVYGQQAAAEIERQEKEAVGQQVEVGKQQVLGFTTDFFGAFHFASVTTAHYLRHYKKTYPNANWRQDIKGRVDLLLKRLLPRLLSRRYNAQYVSAPNGSPISAVPGEAYGPSS